MADLAFDIRKQKDSLRSHLRRYAGRVSIDISKYQSCLPLGYWGAFKSLKDEPLLSFSEEQELCWPKIEKEKQMAFYKTLVFRKSTMGFDEPVEGKLIPKEELTVIFVPGLAFDFYGNRLGRGKGFYDRFLNDYKGLKIGVCASERFLSEPIPVDSQFDVSVHYVLSEKFLYKINPYREEK